MVKAQMNKIRLRTGYLLQKSSKRIYWFKKDLKTHTYDKREAYVYFDLDKAKSLAEKHNLKVRKARLKFRCIHTDSPSIELLEIVSLKPISALSRKRAAALRERLRYDLERKSKHKT